MTTESRLARRLYEASPVWLQNVFVTAEGYRRNRKRYGPAQVRWREFFATSFKWSRAELAAYQEEQLRLVLRCAYEHVPFYRRRFEAIHLMPDDVNSVADLPKLPLLEKRDLREAGEGILADNFPRSDLLCSRTGGSTGMPLVTYASHEAEQRMYGFFRARDRMGLEFGTPYASFGSSLVVSPACNRPPFWRYNAAAWQRIYSVYHLSPQTMDVYLEDLSTRRMDYYEGYPTPIYLLARRLLERPRPFVHWPRAVYSTSEELQPGFREAIEEAFHTRVFDQYGQDEKVGCLTEYACGHMHYDMDFGIIEFLPVGRTEAGRTMAEMVCTGFQNFAAPLIRYRVGDLAVLPDEPVGCDLYAGPIVAGVSGRTGHVLVGKTGRLFHNITAIARACRNIEAVQCVQETAGQVTVRVVPAPGFTDSDRAALAEGIRQRMGDELDVTIQAVSEIEKTASGKTLTIISRLPPPETGARPPLSAK